MEIVASTRGASRREVFDVIDAAARQCAGVEPRTTSAARWVDSPAPCLTESWYCCAEPGPDIANYV